MPRTVGTRRLSQSFSRQSFTPPRVYSSKPEQNTKVPHRFGRIHHKSSTTSSLTTPSENRDQFAPDLTSHADNLANRKHELLLAKNGHFTEGEVSEVPNPTPDTGLRPLKTPTTSISTGSTAALNHSVHSVPLSKTGLPTPSALISQANAHAAGIQSPSFPTFFPKATSRPATESTSGASGLYSTRATSKQPHKLAVPFIVLMAVGCALLVIGIFSVVKYYSRPTRRPRPRPSLPVLDDPFADDKGYQVEDSPIFGGKERMSDEICSWTHSTRSETMTAKPPVASTAPTGISYDYGSMTHSPRLQGSGSNWRTQSTYSGHGHTQSVPIIATANSPFQASLQQLQGALSRTASRVSGTSASIYPLSPQTHNSVGIAIVHSPMTTLTADGSSILQRNEPKAALDKARKDEVETAARGLSTTSARLSEVSSYSGMDASSPSFLPYIAPSLEPSKSHAGRCKIKSSYYNPNSYPRISTAALASMNKAAKGFEQKHNVHKSDARRERDTQALTQALGVSTPASDYTPLSPQPTLYPEDFLSVVDVKRPWKQQMVNEKKQSLDTRKDNGKRPSLPVISNATDATTALGSLMLMDFKGHPHMDDTSVCKRISRSGSSKIGLGGTKTGPTPPTAPAKVATTLLSKDKPPSIPLPELLPSLEQMGLEHANPQAYADYRSPTYSIYGLYGSERKSGVGY